MGPASKVLVPLLDVLCLLGGQLAVYLHHPIHITFLML